MELHHVWFVLIAVLWTGYFFLEGFDFGVGMLCRCSAADDATPRSAAVLINTIGPVWDGNEVWLLTAGGATFAAFPRLVRHAVQRLLPAAAAHPRRADRAQPRLRLPRQARRRRAGSASWDKAIFVGSARARVPVGRGPRQHRARRAHRRGQGVTSATSSTCSTRTPSSAAWSPSALFPIHGALFAALKTIGQIRDDARRVATRARASPPPCWPSSFLVWTSARSTATAGSLVDHRRRRRSPSSARSSPTSAAARAGPSPAPSRPSRMAVATSSCRSSRTSCPARSTRPGRSPSTTPSSTPYTLKIMTWSRLVFTPLVLLYQGWTYWVFRKRIGTQHIPAAAQPAALSH